MKCHEARRRLDLFMDGELSVPDTMKVLEHLNLCRPCAAVYDGEKTLRGALKADLGAERAPAGLAARVFSRLSAPAGAVREYRPRRWWALVAAGVFVLLAGSLLFTPSEFQALAAGVAARHDVQRYACREGTPDRECLCAGCCSDVPGRIRGFFDRQGRPDYCAHLEAREAMGYVFQGVAVWPLEGRRIGWSTWRTPDGGTVSHALVDTAMASSGTARLTASGGRWVLFEPRPDRRSACVFVFDGEEEARRFARLAGMALPRKS